MINIRDELLPSYRKAVEAKKKKEEEERKTIGVKAVNLIENVIIPEFRRMHREYPTKASLKISYYITEIGWSYINNICERYNQIDFSYTYEQVKKATEIAEQYGIEAYAENEEGRSTYSFILNFE